MPTDGRQEGGVWGGVVLHEVVGTISQRQLSGSPVCQAGESCALIRERRLSRQARSFKEKKKKNDVEAHPLARWAPLRLANGDLRAQELL